MLVRLCAQRYFCSASKKSHYEVLGINNNATQNEIKTAYYKLSKVFHPDKQKGDNDRFQEISNAYEVIGNPKTRRLYDLGALESDVAWDKHSKTGYEEDGSSAEARQSGGRAPIYDFDQWTRLHYTSTIRKNKENLEEYNTLKNIREEQQCSSERTYVSCFILTVGCALLWWLTRNDRTTRMK